MGRMRIEIALIVGIVFFCCWCIYIIIKMNSSVSLSGSQVGNQRGETTLTTADYLLSNSPHHQHHHHQQQQHPPAPQASQANLIRDSYQAHPSNQQLALKAASSGFQQLSASVQQPQRQQYSPATQTGAPFAWQAGSSGTSASVAVPGQHRGGASVWQDYANQNRWRPQSAFSHQSQPAVQLPTMVTSKYFAPGQQSYLRPASRWQPVVVANYAPAADQDSDPDPDGEHEASESSAQGANEEEPSNQPLPVADSGDELEEEPRGKVNRELEEQVGQRTFSEDEDESNERDKDGNVIVTRRQHMINGKPVKGNKLRRPGNGKQVDFDKVVDEIEGDEPNEYDDTADTGGSQQSPQAHQQQADESRLKKTVQSVNIARRDGLAKPPQKPRNASSSNSAGQLAGDRAKLIGSGKLRLSKRQELSPKRKRKKGEHELHEHRLSESLTAQQWDDDAAIVSNKTGKANNNSTSTVSRHGGFAPAEDVSAGANRSEPGGQVEEEDSSGGQEEEEEEEEEGAEKREDEDDPSGPQQVDAELRDMQMFVDPERFMDSSDDDSRRRKRQVLDGDDGDSGAGDKLAEYGFSSAPNQLASDVANSSTGTNFAGATLIDRRQAASDGEMKSTERDALVRSVGSAGLPGGNRSVTEAAELIFQLELDSTKHNLTNEATTFGEPRGAPNTRPEEAPELREANENIIESKSGASAVVGNNKWNSSISSISLADLLRSSESKTDPQKRELSRNANDDDDNNNNIVSKSNANNYDRNNKKQQNHSERERSAGSVSLAGGRPDFGVRTLSFAGSDFGGSSGSRDKLEDRRDLSRPGEPAGNVNASVEATILAGLSPKGSSRAANRVQLERMNQVETERQGDRTGANDEVVNSEEDVSYEMVAQAPPYPLLPDGSLIMHHNETGLGLPSANSPSGQYNSDGSFAQAAYRPGRDLALVGPYGQQQPVAPPGTDQAAPLAPEHLNQPPYYSHLPGPPAGDNQLVYKPVQQELQHNHLSDEPPFEAYPGVGPPPPDLGGVYPPAEGIPGGLVESALTDDQSNHLASASKVMKKRKKKKKKKKFNKSMMSDSKHEKAKKIAIKKKSKYKKGGSKKKKKKSKNKVYQIDKEFKGNKKGKKGKKGQGEKGANKGALYFKDQGYKKKGFKNAYKKVEEGNKKTYFDEFRDRDHNKKWKRFKDKHHYSQKKNWTGKDKKKFKNYSLNQLKDKKEREGAWREKAASKYKKVNKYRGDSSRVSKKKKVKKGSHKKKSKEHF